MKLKAILDSLKDLDESLHGFYVEKDGKFHLDVEGGEDLSGMKRAKDRERDARKDAEQKARDLQKQVDELENKIQGLSDDDHRKKGDVEALDKSWQDKYDKMEGEYKTKIDSLTGNINTLLVDNEATRMASEIGIENSHEILVPHIKSRLAVQERDGKMETIVNDKDGKPSALSLKELQQEFVDNPAFAPIIVGSKASGSGANGGKGSSGGNDNPWAKDTFNLTKQLEIAKDDPAKAERYKAEASV